MAEIPRPVGWGCGLRRLFVAVVLVAVVQGIVALEAVLVEEAVMILGIHS